MIFDFVARKVKRPPAAQNWVRLNAYGDMNETTARIVQFALAIPSFNYNPGVKACHDKVCVGLDLDTAVKAVRRVGSPAGWDNNKSFVRSFFQHDDAVVSYRDGYADSFSDGVFRVSRDVVVPTRPSYTVRKSGLLIPHVLCGWTSIPFEKIDIRLFMTVLESGLFSYTDYRRAEAQVLMFPMTAGSREASVITRGDFDLLSAADLRDQSALYVEAQLAALPIAEALWHEREEKRAKRDSSHAPEPPHTPREPDLFER